MNTIVDASPRRLHHSIQVANSPSAGHRFAMQMLSWRYESSDKTLSTLPLHAQYDHSNGKSMVHNTLALHAPDQLRQRMAWALSQVFVIGVSGLGKEDQMEPWFAFYECAAAPLPANTEENPLLPARPRTRALLHCTRVCCYCCPPLIICMLGPQCRPHLFRVAAQHFHPPCLRKHVGRADGDFVFANDGQLPDLPGLRVARQVHVRTR